MTVTQALCALTIASEVNSEVMRASALKKQPTEQYLLTVLLNIRSLSNLIKIESKIVFNSPKPLTHAPPPFPIYIPCIRGLYSLSTDSCTQYHH